MFNSFSKSSVCPTKVLALSWRLDLLHGRLPAHSALMRRGVFIPDVGCLFCSHVVEDEMPMVLQCEFAYLVWCGVYQWLGKVIKVNLFFSQINFIKKARVQI